MHERECGHVPAACEGESSRFEPSRYAPAKPGATSRLPLLPQDSTSARPLHILTKAGADINAGRGGGGWGEGGEGEAQKLKSKN
jgi:hypothetical protein